MPSEPDGNLRGFAPLGSTGATCLVLGSMPGAASLAAGEYYAHRRNAFWDIIEALFSVPRSLPYSERVRALESAGMAVWDVLASCRRHGSLDSAIDRASVRVNDIRAFLDNHPAISCIGFNGGSALRLYERHVLPHLPENQQKLPRVSLPSTSPAHARLTLADKIDAWRVLAHNG